MECQNEVEERSLREVLNDVVLWRNLSAFKVASCNHIRVPESAKKEE